MAPKIKPADIKPRSSLHGRRVADVFPVAQEDIKQETKLQLSRHDLEQMTEHELINKYLQIERSVIHERLQQCRILREIRIKFGEDDRRFGEFLTTTILSELSKRMVTRMIQVADFFETKSIDGISWSSALALAEPRNAPAAVEIYKEIAGKELRPVDVVEKINNLMERIKLPKIAKQEGDVIEGKFTTVVSDTSIEKVIEEVAKYTDSASVSIIIQEKPNIGLSEGELQVAINVVLKIVSNLSKMDRMRLWRALIRREEN